jgi:tRNA (guanine37-N1)-methyltransferase
MKIDVLTLFPEIPQVYFATSIMGKTVEKGLVAPHIVNVRDFAYDRHRTCDDAPYGGGAGMVMLAEPLDRALRSVDAWHKRVVYLSPAGRPFTQELAREFAGEEALVFVSGRYEGIDQRLIDFWVDDEVSIGDYVLSSGELAACVVIDAVYRLLEGAITAESLDEESFTDGLLEYPQYTRPEVWHDMTVPEVLRSGNHEAIRKWRLEKRLGKTLQCRPDLVASARDKVVLSAEAERVICNIAGERLKPIRRRKGV